MIRARSFGVSHPALPLGFLQGDRFIPNRPSMNFDLCNHMLLSNDNSENEPQPGADAPAPLRREFQQALRNTLLSPAGGGASKSERGGDGGSAAGGSPRVLSFAERPPPPQDRYTSVLKVGTTFIWLYCSARALHAWGRGMLSVVAYSRNVWGGESLKYSMVRATSAVVSGWCARTSSTPGGGGVGGGGSFFV